MNFIRQRNIHEFELWLDEKGYYYIRNELNKPCFKSKLTNELFKHFEKNQSDKKRTFARCFR